MGVVVFGLLKKNSMAYSYAKLSKYDFGFIRFLGVGLGNLLFPWARFIVATKKYGLKPIEPTWLQIKIGPILRGESDLRFYGDLFSRTPAEIRGIKKIFLLIFKKKIGENFLSSSKLKDEIFVFSGLKNYFEDILKDHNFVRQELLKIAKDTHKIGLNYDFSNCVCMHIRRGDFKIEGWDTSVEWFLWVMNELRKNLGPNLKFKIFSDGTDNELSLILKQKNTEKLFFGSALADLLAMSNSRIFVGSYNSTFSMWASYLGRMPTIWPEKSLLKQLHYDKENNEIEVLMGGILPSAFVENCKKVI
jgi:hypothetical protein